MSISTARLTARKEELTLQFEQTKQQANAIAGALADIEFWLNEAATEGAAPAEPTSKKVKLVKPPSE